MNNNFEEDVVGDNHLNLSKRTPFKKNPFALSSEQKQNLIEEKVRDILDILGLDINDASIKGTPKRVAKMYVNELFGGLDPKNKPKASVFPNTYQYNEMLVEKNITLYSTCEHHLLPIIGKAHVAYISNGNVIGLSKINRIVEYYANRPQVQERLTLQIVEELQKAMNTENVACVIDAKHLCINSRGIRDITSSTVTSSFQGEFQKKETREAFMSYIQMEVNF